MSNDDTLPVPCDCEKGIRAYFDFLAGMKELQSLTSYTPEQFDTLKHDLRAQAGQPNKKGRLAQREK